jgi:hypothetical protein
MCTRLEDHHPKKKKCLKIGNLENSSRPFPKASGNFNGSYQTLETQAASCIISFAPVHSFMLHVNITWFC